MDFDVLGRFDVTRAGRQLRTLCGLPIRSVAAGRTGTIFDAERQLTAEQEDHHWSNEDENDDPQVAPSRLNFEYLYGDHHRTEEPGGARDGSADARPSGALSFSHRGKYHPHRPIGMVTSPPSYLVVWNGDARVAANEGGSSGGRTTNESARRLVRAGNWTGTPTTSRGH